jgi:hypothetical protein
MRWVSCRQVGSGRSHSGLLICLVKGTSAEVNRNKYVFVLLSSGQHLVRRYVIVRGITYITILRTVFKQPEYHKTRLKGG